PLYTRSLHDALPIFRNSSRKNSAYPVERRKPSLALQGFTCSEKPIISEHLLQLRHHGTFHAKMEILHRPLGIFLEAVSLANVYSDRKSTRLNSSHLG